MQHYKGLPSLYSLPVIIRRVALIIVFGISMGHLAEYIAADPAVKIYLKDYVLIVIAFILLVEGMIGFEYLLEKVMPVNRKNIRKRGTIQVTISIIYGFALYYLFQFLAHNDYERIESSRIASMFIAIGMLIVVLVVIVTLFGRITEKWLISIKEVEQLKREKIQISYNILQDQLNPHFLFNNLSVLKSLVLMKQEKKAASFIQNLSGVYRYVLQHKENRIVTVESELEFINKYFALHKERLGDGININFNISEDVLAKEIPPMTLQLLIENSIKHNIADGDKKLIISVRSELNSLVVENNVQPRDSSYSTKTGLRNLISRYKLLTDDKVEIIEGNSSFAVKVPLL